MKIFFIFIISIATVNALSQEGVQLGIEISPAWDVNLQRPEAAGIISAFSGYGFNVGVPLKWWFSESMAFQSGLTFEYMAFDNRVNNTLFSSERYGSINLPLMLNYAVSGNWFLLFGGGMNYNLFVQSWSGFSLNILSLRTKFQPYAGFGVSTMMERDKGVFELGAQARYHFLELNAPTTSLAIDNNSNVLSFDLLLRFYLFNSVK